jgi:hypothetical protein
MDSRRVKWTTRWRSFSNDVTCKMLSVQTLTRFCTFQWFPLTRLSAPSYACVSLSSFQLAAVTPISLVLTMLISTSTAAQVSRNPTSWGNHQELAQELSYKASGLFVLAVMKITSLQLYSCHKWYPFQVFASAGLWLWAQLVRDPKGWRMTCSLNCTLVNRNWMTLRTSSHVAHPTIII